MERGGIEQRAERLRETARSHEIVRKLKGQLEPARADGPVPEPGLYIDTSPQSSVVAGGELRIPVAGVLSSDGDQLRRLASVQAVTHVDDPLERWTPRLTLHVPGFETTVEMEDEASWFLRILEMHYRESEGQVRFQTPVEA